VSSTVTVTLVFTDLVGSSAPAFTPKTPSDYDTHFAIAREAVVASGGNEVKNLGDGLMVAFFSPSRALACAVAMQPGIERQNRRAEIPLAVRIGIADGSPSATSDLGTWAFLLREWRFRPIPRSYPTN
jgi:class 3 adenylate cyclase